MNWDDFRIVAAVCKTGSFGRAGRILLVNETTVGRRISRLEAELEVALFEAVDGMRRPTPACMTILRSLKDMETVADDIRRTLREHDHPQRRFRLTTVPAIAEYWLSPRLPRLLDELPDLSLMIDTSDRNLDMSRWEADFALRLGRPKQGAFLMRRIGQMDFSLVRPRDCEGPEPLLVTYPETLAEMPEIVALREVVGSRPGRLETSNLNLIWQMLASGQAVGVLPERLARALVDRPELAVTPLPVSREIWLLSQPYLREEPLARALSAWCASLFAAPEASVPLSPRKMAEI